MQTVLTRILGCKYPIIAGPMFLISDENLMIAICRTGATAAMPSLNWRQPELFREAVRKVKEKVVSAAYCIKLSEHTKYRNKKHIQPEWNDETKGF